MNPFSLAKFQSNSLAVCALTLTLAAGAAAGGADSSRVKALLREPPVEYSTGPLWVWNDRVTEREIDETLEDLAGQQVRQVWVHPRPGLMTPYLSEEWFRLWKRTLRDAKRLGMKVWIYDENSYPSGFAGGLVPEAMPESRGRGLVFRETDSPPTWSDQIVAVYRLDGADFRNVTAEARAAANLSPGRYLSALETRSANSPWHGNRSYVNLLSPGVTEKFLDLTLEPYRKALGQEFGKLIPGVFTDEPNIRPAGDLPWSEVLTAEFRKRWGYDLLDFLPCLARPVGDWRRVRHNYFQVLNEQFIEHWAKPYHNYCETNHLEWTGHYWDHEWPHCAGVPDNMAMYAWHQRPAIDCLMNQYAEHTHAQFGNVRMVRELASVANQLGRRRTLCETYGAGGWDLRFEDMKRIGDWLEVLGVNTLNQHLSYVTIRGARKRDHPQSFSYHEPWWPAYHVSAQYFARLSAALSQGDQINRILVLEPTTTAWMYQGDEPRLKELGDSFFKLLMSLEAAQVEYDLGSEDVIERFGSVEKGALKVGPRAYNLVIVPPLLENLNRPTQALLEKVRVYPCYEAPTRVDGNLAETNGVLPKAGAPAEINAWLAHLVQDLQQDQAREGLRIDRNKADGGILFHQRRELADGELLFLVNTSSDQTSSGSIHSKLKGVEALDLYTGATRAYPCQTSAEGIEARFELPPSGSLLLLLTGRPGTGSPKPTASEMLLPTRGVRVERLDLNVLTLDFVDIRAGDEAKTNLYCYQANQFAWKKNGMDRNPWDSAVQYKDEFISRKFPDRSGFEADYRFTIAGAVPKELEIVLERPDLYEVTCNGKPVPKPAGWWLDKAFGRIALSSLARSGENVVTIKASPFTMYHELEPAYVRGSFSLNPVERGFEIVPEHPLELSRSSVSPVSAPAQKDPRRNNAGWAQQGYPFYGGRVKYSELFEIPSRQGDCFVVLAQWRGSVAEVTVNGKKAGYIDAPPWECKITPWIKPGSNEVQVTVFGTLKNTLGPHHGSPGLGAAWPASFHQAPASGLPPGKAYDTVAYGLFEPFVLRRETPEK